MSSMLLPTITKPTRITRNTATLIDNIFTNEMSNDFISGILFCDLSDHLPTFLINKEKYNDQNIENKIQTRTINSNSINAFKTDLENMDWQEIYDCTDPSNSYTLFLNQFLKIYNKRLQIRIIKDNDKRRKENHGLRKVLSNQQYIRINSIKRFLKKPSIKNEEIYRKYKNKLNHILRIAKKKYYNV